MEKKLSAILLAGGFSSRMGKNKAELPFRGTSMIEYQVEKPRSLGITDIVISGYAKPLECARFIPDVYPHRGPLSGVHAGLLAIRNAEALVLAVDTPLVPQQLLRELMESHEGGITLAAAGGRAEPLIGVYDQALAGTCEALLQGERTSMHCLFEKIPPKLVDYAGDKLLLLNCNTPEEYRILREADGPLSNA